MGQLVTQYIPYLDFYGNLSTSTVFNFNPRPTVVTGPLKTIPKNSSEWYSVLQTYKLYL